MCTADILHVHCRHTAYPLHTYCMCTADIRMCTADILHVHCSTYCMCTAHILHVHCILSAVPQPRAPLSVCVQRPITERLTTMVNAMWQIEPSSSTSDSPHKPPQMMKEWPLPPTNHQPLKGCDGLRSSPGGTAFDQLISTLLDSAPSAVEVLTGHTGRISSLRCHVTVELVICILLGPL